MVKQIAKFKMAKVLNRFKEKGKVISISENVYSYIIEKGFDPEFGARFLNRMIENFILEPLTKFILNNPKQTKIKCGIEYVNHEPTLKCELSDLESSKRAKAQ